MAGVGLSWTWVVDAFHPGDDCDPQMVWACLCLRGERVLLHKV